jgi:plasmid maintenance system antidote protein VapI
MSPILIFGAIIGIIRGVFNIVSGKNKRNRENAIIIRKLCKDLGVPDKSYNQIVREELDLAKKMAVEMNTPGEITYQSPANTRLALAIYAIYKQNSEIEKIIKPTVDYYNDILDFDKDDYEESLYEPSIVDEDSVKALNKGTK